MHHQSFSPPPPSPPLIRKPRKCTRPNRQSCYAFPPHHHPHLYCIVGRENVQDQCGAERLETGEVRAGEEAATSDSSTTATAAAEAEAGRRRRLLVGRFAIIVMSCRDVSSLSCHREKLKIANLIADDMAI